MDLSGPSGPSVKRGRWEANSAGKVGSVVCSHGVREGGGLGAELHRAASTAQLQPPVLSVSTIQCHCGTSKGESQPASPGAHALSTPAGTHMRTCCRSARMRTAARSLQPHAAPCRQPAYAVAEHRVSAAAHAAVHPQLGEQAITAQESALCGEIQESAAPRGCCRLMHRSNSPPSKPWLAQTLIRHPFIRPRRERRWPAALCPAGSPAMHSRQSCPGKQAAPRPCPVTRAPAARGATCRPPA
jgi:hypothetical protein